MRLWSHFLHTLKRFQKLIELREEKKIPLSTPNTIPFGFLYILYFYFSSSLNFNSICSLLLVYKSSDDSKKRKKNITKLPYALATGTSRATLGCCCSLNCMWASRMIFKLIKIFFFVVRPGDSVWARYLSHLHILLLCFILFYCYSGQQRGDGAVCCFVRVDFQINLMESCFGVHIEYLRVLLLLLSPLLIFTQSHLSFARYTLRLFMCECVSFSPHFTMVNW